MRFVHVSSEIDPLKKVIVHRPDVGISRISPKRAEQLLFDDIVHLPLMQEEHDVFTAVLEAFLGAENVLEVNQLLKEALDAKEEPREDLLKMILDFEELPSNYFQLLDDLNHEELANTLISGYLAKKEMVLFDPVPNYIFTRDIAVTINGFVVITKAAKEARYRENILTRFIFRSHPMFKQLRAEDRIINLNKRDDFPPSKNGGKVSMEGGDMMIISEDYLLIGCSERTTEYSVHSLMKVLFEKGVVNNVVQINIPNDRSCMHIDTLFTQVNHNHIVAYKPIVMDGISSKVIVHRKDGSNVSYPSVKEFFTWEINPNMEFIAAGRGVSPYQEREQWTDGCNLVALRPGIGITYDRNPETERAFEEAGYAVVPASVLLEKFVSGELRPEEVEDTIVTIPSTELSRARGGSHCMTCPVLRGD
ncbi:MAG: arginine deiminase family protein [Saprospiraceae bacterium]